MIYIQVDDGMTAHGGITSVRGERGDCFEDSLGHLVKAVCGTKEGDECVGRGRRRGQLSREEAVFGTRSMR